MNETRPTIPTAHPPAPSPTDELRRDGMRSGPHGGHFDQLIRQTRAHHVSLSIMADNKANMLITVSAITIPLTIQYIDDPELRYPALTLVFFAILTASLAAYAAMPKIRPAARAPRGSKGFNPLFFGDFVGLTYDEYLEEMEKVFRDAPHAYEAQVREVYLLGQYLAHRKYKYVRLGYMSFLMGLVTSGTVWVVMEIAGRVAGQ